LIVEEKKFLIVDYEKSNIIIWLINYLPPLTGINSGGGVGGINVNLGDIVVVITEENHIKKFIQHLTKNKYIIM
jgi:hypothetical protein